MNRSALASHALVCLSIIAGIAGMSLVYDAAAGGGLHELTFGMPLLLAGLWWSGRALGRSTLASRNAKRRPVGASRAAAGAQAAEDGEIGFPTLHD